MNKVSYVTELKYLHGIIVEYDVRKSNISILYSLGAITKELYESLYIAPKLQRNITIGLMEKNNRKLHKIIGRGLVEYKDKFYSANSIKVSDIVSIHNDAIFLINRTPTITKFDHVEFTKKGVYTSFIKLFSLEIYYYFGLVNNREDIEVKGISDKSIFKHDNYFLEFLKVVLYTLQIEGVENAIDIIRTFSIKYNNRELDISYYREFNSRSLFKLNDKYYVDMCDRKYIYDIDISYNYNIIRELFSIVSTSYFNKIS